MAEYLEERRGNYTGEADAVVLPANSSEVASVVKICADSNIPIVPQGGNTGLCGGAVSKTGQIILNLRRLNRITDVDPINDTMTVEAGCILADIQQAASNIERYFPLSLGAEGSCQIGGNLSTNAGGINVLRYGNAREQVLGLQAVLPDGQIWSDLNELRKNNTGYDLRNLLVGSEGTLGIITAAVLKLYPQPRQVETAFVFELIPKLGIELAEKHVPGCRNPLSTSSDWHIIMVYSSAANGTDLRLALENTLANALDNEIISDAVISASETQTTQIWKIREGLVEAQQMAGERYTYDVSVKISQVPEFIERAGMLAQSKMTGIRPYAFGHVGDGNIHLSLFQPDDVDGTVFRARLPEFDELIFNLVHEYGGSFSAEHGIGLLKLEEMSSYKDPAGLSVMRAIKQAVDPFNIMNPGKVLP